MADDTILRLTLAVIIGTLAAIVYSLRVLVMVERRVMKIEHHIDGIAHKILFEERRLASRLPARKVARPRKKSKKKRR